MSLQIYSNNHSYFALYYELILVTKGRVKIFDEKIINTLVEHFKKISGKYLIEFIKIENEKDHLHINFKSEAKSDLVKFITAYKTSTSRIIKREYPHIKTLLNDNSVWEKTYFLISTRVPTEEVVKHFISMKLDCCNKKRREK